MKKTTGALVSLCATGPLLLAVPILAIGAGTASASCSTGGAQTVNAGAVAKQVKAILHGGDKGKVSVPGLDDPVEQVPNAKTIQATGVAMNIPARGQVVALATALQESGLRNLTYGDRDSLGLFQQRPSQGWGTANQILDPVHASTKFYEGLKKVSGWQSLSITQAAQAVQRSGFPEAYAKWEPLATALQRAIEPLLLKDGNPSPNPSPSGSADASSPSPSAGDGCSADGDGTDFGTIPMRRSARRVQDPRQRVTEGADGDPLGARTARHAVSVGRDLHERPREGRDGPVRLLLPGGAGVQGSRGVPDADHVHAGQGRQSRVRRRPSAG